MKNKNKNKKLFIILIILASAPSVVKKLNEIVVEKYKTRYEMDIKSEVLIERENDISEKQGSEILIGRENDISEKQGSEILIGRENDISEKQGSEILIGRENDISEKQGSKILIGRESSTSKDSFDEVIVSLVINKSNIKGGLTVFFDKEGMPWIELNELFEKLELKNYSIEEDRVSFHLNGEEILKKINTIKVDMGSLILFSTVEEIFKETEVEWNLNEMRLDITTQEVFPWEFMELQEKARGRLDNRDEEEEVINAEWELFTPGILYLGYSMNDFSKGNGYLNMNYTNQILYGSLKVNASSYGSDFDIDNFVWERNVGEGRKVMVGEVYLNSPFRLGSSRSMRGFSLLGKNSWDSSLNVGSGSIQGYGSNGVTVELYENGILKDYQIIRNGEFNFEIISTGGARNYELWTYNLDGSIDKELVAIYGTNKLLKKGEFDYEIQMGQDQDYKKYNPYNMNALYGFTENFTLKMGIYNASYDVEEKKFINLSPIYRIGSTGNWSHVISADYSINTTDKDESFYQATIQSGNNHISNTFGLENYKNLDGKFLNENYDEKFFWRNRFQIYGVNTSLSFEKERDSFRSENIDRYGLTLYDSFFRGRISASIGADLEKNSKYKGRQNNFRSALTYNIQGKNIRKHLNSIVFDYTRREDGRDTYGVTFQKSRGTKGRYDYYLSLKRERDESFVSLSFTYRLGDWMNIRSYTQRDKERVTQGITVNTAVDFSNPKKIYYSEYSGDSSIMGRVFVDTNGNGIMDPGEKGISQVTVKNAAGEGTTDEDGRYYIPLMSSRVTHTLNIYNKNDEYLMNYIIPEKYLVKTLPGGSLKLDIPVRQIKIVVGHFEFDSDFYLEDVQEILQNSHLKIVDVNTGKVKIVNLQSEYVIMELAQGDYLIEMVYEGDQKIPIINKKYLVKMNDSEEFEEYLDFKIEKNEDNTYDVGVTYNGVILEELDEIEYVNN